MKSLKSLIIASVLTVGLSAYACADGSDGAQQKAYVGSNQQAAVDNTNQPAADTSSTNQGAADTDDDQSSTGISD